MFKDTIPFALWSPADGGAGAGGQTDTDVNGRDGGQDDRDEPAKATNGAATRDDVGTNGKDRSGDRWDADTPTIDKVRIERDRVRKELRARDAQIADLASQLQQFRDADAKAEGRWEDLIKSKDAQIADRDKQIAEFRENERKRVVEQRQTSFLEGVANRLDFHNMTVLRGVLRELSDERGIDIAPEEVTDNRIDEGARAVTEALPDLFKPKARGGSRGTPGHNPQHVREGEELAPNTEEERIKAMAKKYSHVPLAERAKRDRGE